MSTAFPQRLFIHSEYIGSVHPGAAGICIPACRKGMETAPQPHRKSAVSGLHRTSLRADADHHHCVCLGNRLCRTAVCQPDVPLHRAPL